MTKRIKRLQLPTGLDLWYRISTSRRAGTCCRLGILSALQTPGAALALSRKVSEPNLYFRRFLRCFLCCPDASTLGEPIMLSDVRIS